MCFSSEVSLTAFTLNVLCALYLLYNGIKYKNKDDLIFSIIIVLIGLIQFVEYIIWNNQSCNMINHYATLFIPLVLYLQPVIGFIAYFKFFPEKKFPTIISQSTISILSILYTFVTLYYIYILNQSNLCSKPSPESCRLMWGLFDNLSIQKFIIMSLFSFFWGILAALLYIFLYLNGDSYKYPGRYLIVPITWLIAVIYVGYTEITYNYEMKVYDFNHTIYNFMHVFGSVWCFLAVVEALTAVLYI
jgi:hypothetical protein